MLKEENNNETPLNSSSSSISSSSITTPNSSPLQRKRRASMGLIHMETPCIFYGDEQNDQRPLSRCSSSSIDSEDENEIEIFCTCSHHDHQSWFSKIQCISLICIVRNKITDLMLNIDLNRMKLLDDWCKELLFLHLRVVVQRTASIILSWRNPASFKGCYDAWSFFYRQNKKTIDDLWHHYNDWNIDV